MGKNFIEIARDAEFDVIIKKLTKDFPLELPVEVMDEYFWLGTMQCICELDEYLTTDDHVEIVFTPDGEFMINYDGDFAFKYRIEIIGSDEDYYVEYSLSKMVK